MKKRPWVRGLAIGALLGGCTTAVGTLDGDDPPTDAPHGHTEAVYPATPAQLPLPLKNSNYPGARYRQARFFTPGRSRQIDAIVIHTTEGRYSGTINWFQDPNNQYKTSAHYVIQSSDGEITQMVRESDTAHHVRGWNSRSIGLEHEAFVAQSRWYTDAMYASSARLVRHLCQKYNIPMDRQHIRSHAELDPSRRSDPGRHWDWDKYMRLVRAGGDAPQPPAQPPADDQCSDRTLWNCNAARTGRFRCEGGRIAQTEDCGAGCQVMPVGQNDVCRPGSMDGEDWGACTAGGIPGTCMRTAACMGRATPGHCPGPNDVQCCTQVNDPAPPAEPPPNREGQACTVGERRGQCVATANRARCEGNLEAAAACGDAAACCVVPDDPAPPAEPAPPGEPPPAEPPPAEPPPAEPPPAEPDGQCQAQGLSGQCMAPEVAFFQCPWPEFETHPAPTCAADAVCCVRPDRPQQPEEPADPPRAEPVDECWVDGEDGVCLPTGTCASEGGRSTPGHCPGARDIQCCTW